MGGGMSLGGFEVKVLTANDPQLQAYVKNTKPTPHRCDDRVDNGHRTVIQRDHDRFP